MARLQVVLDPLQSDEEDAISVRTRRLTPDRYRAFCRANPELRIERTASGEVLIMPPAHSRTGYQNAQLIFQLMSWALRDATGIAFDSSAGFDLPNGANRSPDASWILKSRIDAIPPEQREEYLPLCPDFVIELRSRSDRLPDLHDKMSEYIDNGACLGWLIDPIDRQVFIYRPGASAQHLLNPSSLAGDPELPGFTLDLSTVWNPVL